MTGISGYLVKGCLMMGEAAWIKTVDDEEATGKVSEVYAVAERAEGAGAPFVKASSLWPELMEAQEREYKLLMGANACIDVDTRNLVAAYVAQINMCEYLVERHRGALKGRGWSDEKITHVLQDICSDHLNIESRAILIYADKITRRPQAMSGEDVDEMRMAGVDDRRILEAAALAGYVNYTSRMANALGVSS